MLHKLQLSRTYGFFTIVPGLWPQLSVLSLRASGDAVSDSLVATLRAVSNLETKFSK